MTEKQMYATLNKFANQHSIAKGGNIKVNAGPYVFDMKPKDGGTMRYEDCAVLRGIVRGAEHFLMWKRRGGK